ncbi:hypothetical protein EMIT0P218_150086 [Pseudomonas sp. IT-P218]
MSRAINMLMPANRYCLPPGGSGGASPDEVKAKLGKILQGADPPHSEAAVQQLMHDSGFGDATRFFSSLFWGAWLTRKTI